MVSSGYPGHSLGSGKLGPLHELLDSLPAAAVAYVAGPDLVFEFASDGYRQVIGGRDGLGRPLREALPEVVGPPPVEVLRPGLRAGEAPPARRGGGWLGRAP